MSVRQTRLEYRAERTRLRAPKSSASDFMAKVKRLMARRMVADGVIEPKDGARFEWRFKVTLPPTYASLTDATNRGNVVSGTVPADTKSEARSAIKKVLKLDRLPPGTTITKESNADSTRSVGAA